MSKNPPFTPAQLHTLRVEGKAPDAAALRFMQGHTRKGVWWVAYRYLDHMRCLAVGAATDFPKIPATFPGEPQYGFEGYVDLTTGAVENPEDKAT